MTTLLSPDDLRRAFETDLGDAELQLIIDDADATIIDRVGAHQGDELNTGLITEELYGTGGVYLFPSRPASNIASVTEYGHEPFSIADVGVALAADDYRLIHGGRTLERLVTGMNARDYWGLRAVIEYTPISQTARRTRVELDLCRLTLTYQGMIKNERAGDYARGMSSGVGTPDAYQKEREAVLFELLPKGLFV